MSWNEWFIIICGVIAMSLYLLIRKHFEPIVKIMVWIYTVAYIETIDYGLAKTPFAVYYCMDNTTYEFSAGIIHIFICPPSSFIFLYFYTKWEIKGRKLVYYIMFWTVIAVLYEWMCVINGVFTYTGWKLYYSIAVYPISQLLLIWLYHFINKHIDEPIPRNGSAAAHHRP